MQGDPNKFSPDEDELKYHPDDDELRYTSNGQQIYYSGLPSIASIPGHQHTSHMQFSNNSISSTNGLMSGNLHSMHSINSNGLIVACTPSPDHINSNSPNSNKKKGRRKFFLKFKSCKFPMVI